MKVELTKYELSEYIKSLKIMLKMVNNDEDDWISWKMQLESTRKTMELIRELEKEQEKNNE